MRLLKYSFLWFTVLAVLLLVVCLYLTVKYWGWLHPEDSETVSNSETLRNVGFLIAGGLALLFALWRGWVAERQAAAAQLQADTAQDSSLNERYEQGAEMLGNDALAVRLGGVCLLERLAQDYPKEFHIQVMELLCAFIRNSTKDEKTDTPPRTQFMMSELREDVQAAVTAIGRRSKRGIRIEEATGITPLDLYRADLSGANLSGLNFAGADFREARFIRANLMNSDLRGAFLAGANLVDPYFIRDWEELDEFDPGSAMRVRLLFKDADVSGTYFSMAGMYVVTSIIQEQLDNAYANPDDLPILDNVRDAVTGNQLVWRVATCDGDD